jgi:diaminohydroxyphosphoribosylaminopyrimidine deaminase/5-amino-6-(5-phosphoribosylamino)uracil reductase
MMDLALGEARKCTGWVEPNPQVGAVIVREGKVVGVGHHTRFGGPHAEVAALQQAGEAARGGTLYVTLEPCCHQGKTPPCTGAILESGITRVVAAIRDPFPRVAGGGLALLRQAGIPVELGLRGREAIELNAPYLKRTVIGRPYVTAKWAMTLDGKAAVARGNSQWISSPSSRSRVHELRGRMDAIVVGIGTVLADDPQLTARPPGPRIATRIVLDSKATLPPACRLATTAREIPVLVGVSSQASEQRVAVLRDLGCEVLACPGSCGVAIQPLLDELGRRGMTNVLLEGGGRVLGSFLDEDQVDEIDAFIAPILEGGDHPRTPVRGLGLALMSDAKRLTRVSHELADGDVRVRGTLEHPWRTSLELLCEETTPP